MKNDDKVYKMRHRTIPAWFTHYIQERIAMENGAEPLVNALFSLDEPWRGHFLEWLAKLATRHTWGGGRPTQEEVATWLGTSSDLRRQVRLLLSMWRGPRDDPL